MRRPQISSFAGTAVNRPTTTVRHYFAAAPKLMAEKWSKKAGKTVAPPCLRGSASPHIFPYTLRAVNREREIENIHIYRWKGFVSLPLTHTPPPRVLKSPFCRLTRCWRFSLDLGHKPTLNPFITIKVGYRQADFIVYTSFSNETFLILCLIGSLSSPPQLQMLTVSLVFSYRPYILTHTHTQSIK